MSSEHPVSDCKILLCNRSSCSNYMLYTYEDEDNIDSSTCCWIIDFYAQFFPLQDFFSQGGFT